MKPANNPLNGTAYRRPLVGAFGEQRRMTLMRKFKPVLITEAIALGLAVVMAIRGAPRFSGGMRLLWWLVRGTVIGPFELLVNSQSMSTAGGPPSMWSVLLSAVVCVALITAPAAVISPVQHPAVPLRSRHCSD